MPYVLISRCITEGGRYLSFEVGLNGSVIFGGYQTQANFIQQALQKQARSGRPGFASGVTFSSLGIKSTSGWFSSFASPIDCRLRFKGQVRQAIIVFHNPLMYVNNSNLTAQIWRYYWSEYSNILLILSNLSPVACFRRGRR